MNIYAVVVQLRDDVVAVRAFTEYESARYSCEVLLGVMVSSTITHTKYGNQETWTARNRLGSPWKIQLRKTKLEGA